MCPASGFLKTRQVIEHEVKINFYTLHGRRAGHVDVVKTYIVLHSAVYVPGDEAESDLNALELELEGIANSTCKSTNKKADGPTPNWTKEIHRHSSTSEFTQRTGIFKAKRYLSPYVIQTANFNE